MSNTITANNLKTKGVSLFKKLTANNEEVIISVRGKNKYVVLAMEEYNRLRECELEAALAETKRDLENNKYFEESVKDHIKRITSV